MVKRGRLFSMEKIEIGIIGASGKFGRSILALAMEDPALRIAAGVGRAHLGCDLGALAGKEQIGVPLTNDCGQLFEMSTIIIDVSVAENLEHILTLACKKKKPLVIGTTGHSQDNLLLMQRASQSIPLFHSPNFSLGVAAMASAVSMLSQALGGSCEIKIDETHHIYKKDRPSGTALKLARTVTEACNKEPPIASQRVGEFIGDHTVTFSCEEEQISIRHSALSRSIFAKGALLAVKFLARQPPGLYSMRELLVGREEYAPCKN